MRGRSTWLLLAALIGLGAVAAVDALRGGGRDPERVGAVATTSPAADLRRADVTGVLYFTMRSENGCRRAVLLRYVREMAWLADSRLVAVLAQSTGEVGDVVMVFEGGRAVPGDFIPAGSSVYVSREAQEILVAYPTAGVGVYDRRGVFLSQNRFTLPDIGAVAGSPDGRWVALARPGNVGIYAETEPPPRERFPVACLAFDAVDIAWL